MVAPPAPTPDAWAAMPAYTQLLILHQRDHNHARKKAIAIHLASLAPYAHTGADSAAASLIAQHYPAEADRLASTPQQQAAADTHAIDPKV